ncbi:hypothetical protein TEA_012769 [Camellia sinensis var. sinensis]|uniref:Uncharacterized protein n=1 Tax=Camellia sinensis var. sinensis TaxID=542762 RepID=A0A4S4DVI7_CAMSN|nr:hypothetical protein TEA_012769 [Camellia sinensis var. sinensis]
MVARMESDGSSEIKQVEQSCSNKTDSSAKETKKGKEKEIAARKGGRTRPPLSFLSILKDANIEIDMSCPHKLCDLLYAGVYLKPNTLASSSLIFPHFISCKYFVDKKSNKNCFALFPREFYICWGENPKYWKWTKEKEPSGEDIEVAELLDVCWLEVRGKIDTIDLSPGALYEIVFVLKVKEKWIWKVIPLAVIWSLWKLRNECIFKSASPQSVDLFLNQPEANKIESGEQICLRQLTFGWSCLEAAAMEMLLLGKNIIWLCSGLLIWLCYGMLLIFINKTCSGLLLVWSLVLTFVMGWFMESAADMESDMESAADHCWYGVRGCCSPESIGKVQGSLQSNGRGEVDQSSGNGGTSKRANGVSVGRQGMESAGLEVASRVMETVMGSSEVQDRVNDEKLANEVGCSMGNDKEVACTKVNRVGREVNSHQVIMSGVQNSDVVLCRTGLLRELSGPTEARPSINLEVLIKGVQQGHEPSGLIQDLGSELSDDLAQPSGRTAEAQTKQNLKQIFKAQRITAGSFARKGATQGRGKQWKKGMDRRKWVFSRLGFQKGAIFRASAEVAASQKLAVHQQPAQSELIYRLLFCSASFSVEFAANMACWGLLWSVMHICGLLCEVVEWHGASSLAGVSLSDQIAPGHHAYGVVSKYVTGGNHVFRTLYIIGDNPSVDIKGAKQAGHPWFSILTRTGVFKGKENHAEHPADLVGELTLLLLSTFASQT